MFNARWLTIPAIRSGSRVRARAGATNRRTARGPSGRPVVLYRHGRQRRAVVLMHAATGSVRVWEHQIPAFTKAGFRVISFDRRGWGRTESAPGAPPGTAADDLHRPDGSPPHRSIPPCRHRGRGLRGFRLRRSHFQSACAASSSPTASAACRTKRSSSSGAASARPNSRRCPPNCARCRRRIAPATPTARADGWSSSTSAARQDRGAAQPLKNRITFALLETITVPALLLTGDADMFAPPPVLRMFAAASSTPKPSSSRKPVTRPTGNNLTSSTAPS